MARLLRPFADHVSRAAWQTGPTSYVITELDNSLPVELQENMATRTNDVRLLPASHTPHPARMVTA
ncbi:hypothetical protein [Amycolatopsis sp. NPDC051903]|uniref:hypothetical protein n=1 Tax=Amycolatopsis sp. NPDC051903 TaxID=3363936 RepID=UPI0037BACCDC